MHIKWFIGVVSLGVALQFMPQGAQAFECPKHFTAAQAAIDKVVGDMKGGMSKMMAKADMAQVHLLLDDAKMLLAGAKHNHEKPQGRLDHARAIAKADSARGYAVAADMLHFKMMIMLPELSGAGGSVHAGASRRTPVHSPSGMARIP